MDPQGYHILAYMDQRYKYIMHTIFRNSLFRVASVMGSPPIGALEFLARRSTESSDRYLGSGIAPNMSFSGTTANIFGENINHQFNSTSKYTERKRLSNHILKRCAAQNIGFESLVRESIGREDVGNIIYFGFFVPNGR